MFPTRTLLKLMSVLEEDLGVNHFAVGDFHLWPALRFVLATKLQDNDQSKTRTEHVIAAEAEIERRFDALMAARPPNPDQPPAALVAAQPLAHAASGRGVLLISRSEDHSLRTPNGFYAPVIDPWAGLSESRWPCVKAELVSAKFNETQPRCVMTLAMVGHAVSQQNKADMLARDNILRSSKIFTSLVGKWLHSELGISLPELPEVFERELTALWFDKQVYRELLQSVQPGLVITSCYYFRPTLGVVWAARELGIPVADAQHGGNGEYHIGYTHWRNVPAGGYHLLPDYFLVWDNISANNLLRWYPPGAANHQALITGRFGLERANRAGLGDGGRSPMAAITQGSEKVILVTLQTLASTGLSPMIIEAMRKAPPTWTWLVRGHPIAQAWGNNDLMPEALDAKMKAAGIARFESKLTTALPLAAILPFITHHLTGFSGTVQECAAYKIRTTFTHPTVWSFFGKFIDLGAADFADSPEAVLKSLSDPRPFPDLSQSLHVPRDDATAIAVLTQILKPA